MRRPHFVVVEGLDGVGKSTVAGTLAQRLGAELMASPPPRLAGARGILEPLYEDDPLARMLWYASANAAASSDVARVIASGRTVVLARYFLSTLVYAGVRGASCTLSELGRHLLSPDVTVYLHARYDVRRGRMRRRRDNGTEDARTLEPDWNAALDAGYRAAATHPLAGRFVAIDVSDIGPEEATERAVAFLELADTGR